MIGTRETNYVNDRKEKTIGCIRIGRKEKGKAVEEKKQTKKYEKRKLSRIFWLTSRKDELLGGKFREGNVFGQMGK